MNNRKRWIVDWKNSTTKPEIYHCISRIVGRGFVLETKEREHFRMLMRMCEKFTGCRVLSYCLMSNHFHLLLEVMPIPEGGICNSELLERLGVFYSEAQVAEIAKEMEDAASVQTRAGFEMTPLDENGVPLTPAQERVVNRVSPRYLTFFIVSPGSGVSERIKWFFKFFLGSFLGTGERAGSDGSISGMSGFGSFRRFGLGGMNGWKRVRVVATTGWRVTGFPVLRHAPFAWRPGVRALGIAAQAKYL